MTPTVHKSNTPPEAAPDDVTIPVLTERLTLPPLELDTSLPMDLPLDMSLPRDVAAAAEAPSAAPPAPVPPAPAAPVVAAPKPPAPSASLSSARLPTTPFPTATPLPTPAAPPPSAAAISEVSSTSHWTRIELELRTSILRTIAESLPQQVDSIVRNRMNEAIEQFLAQLAGEAQLAVAASLRDIIDQAVRAELARLRAQKR
jgi:hypothetical protein